MTSACATEVAAVGTAGTLAFAEADPAAVAPRLDGTSIHLWRITHARSERRAPLRRLLGAYLGADPAAIDFGEGPAGKPYLAGVAGQPWRGAALDFNWSHSGPWALVAIARNQPVGVDIEQLAKRVRARALAQRFFAPGEAAALRSVAGDPTPAFIGLWCAKEAVLKAAGRGLAFGLERLAFERRADIDWRLARIDPALGALPAWRLIGFPAAAGYRGALAWRGAERTIEAYRPPA